VRYLKPFEYFEPQTLEEAVALLEKHGGDARIMAGGTDLLVKMKAREIVPGILVNLKSVSDPHLWAIAPDRGGGLKLGALVTLQSIHDSDLVKQRVAVLAETVKRMASHQVRNMATIGGNLCNAAPSADLAPPLMALGGGLTVMGPKGERAVELDDFFRNPGETDLTDHEILVDIRVPGLEDSARITYEKLNLREAMALSTVGVAVKLRLTNGYCEEVRIVLGAVGPTPMRARQAENLLGGRKLGPELIEKAARVASHEAKPITDVRGSATYRRDMVASLVRKAIRKLVG
jgi:carbon-monoxide dehydrogenase medium subunit